DGGFELFWKPHLGYGGSFEWRGDIRFEDEPSWNRFFTGYRLFLLHQARLAARFGAELLAVGVELEGTTHRPEWHALIAEVRTIYSGRLTYAANWDRVEEVPFWSELDVIGVHAYFPLAPDEDPSDEALQRAWDGVLADLAELSERNGGKPILFAEIGYNRSLEAARQPWAYEMDESPAARRLRRRLIALAIRRVENAPAIEGMFWWKWIPGPNHHDRDFSMKDPEARAVLAEMWGDSTRSTGSDPGRSTGGHP
ncbi:MAG: hypothetical protein R3244_13045, partial [Thermoanaerobaculia bacterium]|nr:hypothetical protein [Thermoanaerobaculia bacterium]